jgi:hypothetical protein
LEEEANDMVFDQKTTAANFLATVVSFAEHFGVNYESIFANSLSLGSNSQLFQAFKNDEYIPQPPAFHRQQSTGRFTVDLKLNEKDETPLVNQAEYLNIDLEVHRPFVFRTFDSSNLLSNTSDRSSSEELTTANTMTTYHNFFDFKLSSVANCYFGDYDDGDFKDLKKNISGNFKRFLMSKKEDSV